MSGNKRGLAKIELSTSERWLIVDALQRQAKRHDMANASHDMSERVHEECQRDACLALAARIAADGTSGGRA